MDRQKLLDNFVRLTDGKGRAMYARVPGGPEACCYFPSDHVGCAIGCQPGFRDRFIGKVEEQKGICSILDDDSEVASFFGVEDWEDRQFMSDLQGFHDCECCWTEDGHLKSHHLEAFCKEHNLTVPTGAPR